MHTYNTWSFDSGEYGCGDNYKPDTDEASYDGNDTDSDATDSKKSTKHLYTYKNMSSDNVYLFLPSLPPQELPVILLEASFAPQDQSDSQNEATETLTHNDRIVSQQLALLAFLRSPDEATAALQRFLFMLDIAIRKVRFEFQRQS